MSKHWLFGLFKPKTEVGAKAEEDPVFDAEDFSRSYSSPPPPIPDVRLIPPRLPAGPVCPGCGGELADAVLCDADQDEVIELGFKYCTNSPCMWAEDMDRCDITGEGQA